MGYFVILWERQSDYMATGASNSHFEKEQRRERHTLLVNTVKCDFVRERVEHAVLVLVKTTLPRLLNYHCPPSLPPTDTGARQAHFLEVSTKW